MVVLPKQTLDSPRTRYGWYALLLLAFFGLSLAIGRFDGKREGTSFNLVLSDARGYYAYLPSVVIDGDLDFSNQIREHWGSGFSPALLEDRTELGLVRNKYPVGLALTLSPFFLAGDSLAHFLHACRPARWCLPDGYSVPYQVSCLVGLLFLSWLTFLMVDDLLVRRFAIRGPFAFAAICLAVAGTNLAYYEFREPFMVHVGSLFWCTLVIAMTDRVLAGLDEGRLRQRPVAFLGLAAGMALVCRPSNLFLLPFLLCIVLEALRQKRVRLLLGRLPLAAFLAALPLLAQCAAWKATTGHWISYSYKEEGFSWGHPALWETLFSSRHGLLFWSPLLLLALAGFLVRLARTRERLLVCYLLAFLLLWYCNSAWHTWWFGAGFGARAFLEVWSLFALGLGFGLQRAWDSQTPRWRAWQTWFITASVGYNWVMMFLFFKRFITHEGYLF